ncbi:hypothetical protein V8B97DRAFT_1453741 [Scleroderma yunnanense]
MVLVRCLFPSMDILSENSSGCVLILEYSYFYLQSNNSGGGPNGVFASAVKEYQYSGTQATVCKALQEAIQVHGDDKAGLQKAIINIILDFRMSKKLLKSMSK